MVRRVVLALAICAPQALWADCAATEQRFVSCQIEGRKTEMSVCYTADMATYRYGPLGQKPDLVLSSPMLELAYQPWSGVGRDIWENVSFTNDGYRYEVGAGTPRLFSEADAANPPPPYASVTVLKGDTILTTLDCTTESLNYDNSEVIFAAKEALGLQWDYENSVWIKP